MVKKVLVLISVETGFEQNLNILLIIYVFY